jgi:excisionase family DNA binding protein
MAGHQVKRKRRASRLVGRPQAAGYLNVTPRTVDRLVARGLLNPIRLPGIRRTLFDRVDLDALIDTVRETAK